MIRAKTATIQDTIDLLFSKGSGRNRQPSIEGLGTEHGFRPKSTRFEARADETTRLVREITDKATEQRHAKTASLRAARLGKEAEDRAAAALAPAKKAPRPRKRLAS
jgi:hypothetical protein